LAHHLTNTDAPRSAAERLTASIADMTASPSETDANDPTVPQRTA
jgi:hypothetical protein